MYIQNVGTTAYYPCLCKQSSALKFQGAVTWSAPRPITALLCRHVTSAALTRVPRDHTYHALTGCRNHHVTKHVHCFEILLFLVPINRSLYCLCTCTRFLCFSTPCLTAWVFWIKSKTTSTPLPTVRNSCGHILYIYCIYYIFTLYSWKYHVFNGVMRILYNIYIAFGKWSPVIYPFVSLANQYDWVIIV